MYLIIIITKTQIKYEAVLVGATYIYFKKNKVRQPEKIMFWSYQRHMHTIHLSTPQIQDNLNHQIDTVHYQQHCKEHN